MTPTYQYEELPVGKYIRLLRLLPSPPDSSISLELFTTELTHAPSYESISYCWGDPHDQSAINCSAKTMFITKSLYTGLKHFRHPDRARILWADAICINQSDDKEKGVQVNMMGDIYDCAIGVLVWLGEDLNHDAEKAFRLLRAINEYVDSQIVESEIAINPWRAVANVPTLIDRKILFHDPSETQALHNFWCCSWFSRVWVLQEVALASTVRVFWGASSLSLSEVIQSAYLLSWRPDLQVDFHVGRWADAFADTLITYTTKETWMQETRLLIHWQESLARRAKPTLNKILSSASRFEATNPLDHIYAFLGHPAAKSKDGKSSLLEADYTITIDEACQLLARKLYERDQRLDFLCTGSPLTLSEIFDSPSWIPKVHRPKMAHSLDHQSWNADGAATTDFPTAVFEADMLHGWSLVFDAIATYSPVFGWDLFDDEEQTQNAVEMCWKVQTDSLLHTDPSDRLFAFMRTLVGGSYTGGMAPLQRDFSSYCRDKTSSEFCDEIGLDGIRNEEISSAAGSGMQFQREAYINMQGRRFLITKEGRYGLGPSFLQEGDVCCVLLGCRMPLVMRPASTDVHFKVIGPCYIDCAMYGEIIDAYAKSFSDLTEVTLV